MPPDLPLSHAVVVISDLVEPATQFSTDPCAPSVPTRVDLSWPAVGGGYLERLPLALVRSGVADFAEIWHHHRGDAVGTFSLEPALVRRSFPVDSDAPFHSDAMIAFVREHGAPRILCVWGLGVSEAVIEACSESVIIYNSIDVPALRVPLEVSRHFDIVLAGSPRQVEDILARHPKMTTDIMPIGPDFASPETFFPIETQKDYDVIYVAAAQAYKRHDILFNAIERSAPPLKALCVIGYGEEDERLKTDAKVRGLDVDFVGPPGVSHSEVNRLMNRARVGVVCGVDDGAPAILTEYMLADLPVVANAELRCGLQYITPQTGVVAAADRFEHGIREALSRTDFSSRQVVLDRWTWPHSVARLAALIGTIDRGFRAEGTPGVQDSELA